ncbi:MAG: sodium:proton antiporter [Planctomycetes bacterium]|nr:sodium:proton antiporter [Planctomycetota bacterium]
MHRRRLFGIALVLLLASGAAVAPMLQADTSYALVWLDDDGEPRPDFVLTKGARYRRLALRCMDEGQVDTSFSETASVSGFADDEDAQIANVTFLSGYAVLPPCHVTGDPMVDGKAVATRSVAGFWSIAAPLVAILLAIYLREVLLSLLVGVWVGVVAMEGSLISGTMRTFDRHLIGAIANSDHVKILVFSCLLGALVAMISRMGGVRAIVESLARKGSTRMGAQLITWVSGTLIFFDDYANALLVGNTMRPVTDSYRVSREKLAYLVDSTSAPVACIAPVSTWIATEIGYIDQWLKGYVDQGGTFAGYDRDGAYDIFLDSIPYNFYPILTLAFGLMIVLRKRDFGMMARAERRAAQEGKLIADGATPLTSSEMDGAQPVDPTRLRWWNGAVPILVLVSTVLFGLYWDGIASVENPESLGTFERIRDAFGNANSYNVLLWGSAAGLLSAWVLSLGQRLLTVKDASETTLRGIKAMMTACLVLIMAWTLADLCSAMNTAGWLIEQVTFSFTMLPGIVFVLAAVVGFSTGSSWSTMAILVPLAMSYAAELGVAEGADVAALQAVLLASIGGVLAGSVFGDHCSPISDTTVMSSMAAGCDHMDHVKTQMPYALVVGAVALLCGYIPAGFGVGPWVLLLVSCVLLFVILGFVGRPTENTRQA